MLAQWRLWDHMDAILTLGVTRLVDEILSGRESIRSADWLLDQHQVRDLLLLAACYDQSLAETRKGRWHRLRRRLRFHVLWAQRDLALGLAVTAAIAGAGDRLAQMGLADLSVALFVWRWPAGRRGCGALGNGSGRRGASCGMCGSAICISIRSARC